MSDTKQKRVRKSKYFLDGAYHKPAIMELVNRNASDVWSALLQISKGQFVKKTFLKWTTYEAEQFIVIMNTCLSIQMCGDTGDCGELPSYLSRFNNWIDSGVDPEMRRWLDPDYIFLDWTHYPPVAAGGIPNIPTLAMFPLHPNVITAPVLNFSAAFRVNDNNSAHFFMGLMKLSFPGLQGVVVSVPTALVVW